MRGKALGLTLLCAAGFTGPVLADEVAAPSSAQYLLEKYSELEERLNDNQFMRPVVLESHEAGGKVDGEIYAVVSYPFAAVRVGLNNPDHWCDVMSLHINTKYCRMVESADGVTLKMYVGKKSPQDLKDAERIDFTYTPAEQSPTFFAVRLSSPKGPLATRDYLIALEAVPLPDGETFLHLTYSYSMGFLARVAIKGYLTTIGGGKVGFSSAGNDAEGQPRLIGGVRGLVERNTMRYYLAIDSYLAVANEPPALQLDARLQSWFSAVEEYPQLFELDRPEYLAMKHDEYERQQSTD